MNSKSLFCLTEKLAAALWLMTVSAQSGPPLPPQNLESIPWSQVGAQAGANYQGDGLQVSSAETGARLRCLFQRLEGEVTSEGLWLTSTAPDRTKDRFRVTACSLGSEVGGLETRDTDWISALPLAGTVEKADKLARFIRPGLIEEYSVSIDGVRQDFVVLERPAPSSRPSPPMGEKVAEGRSRGTLADDGTLRVKLSVTGARVEQTTHGAQLVLGKSGRKIAYSRLRVTDATGKELPARMVVGRAVPCAPRFAVNTDDSETTDGAHEVTRSTLAVLVSDSDAVYPIRIDPTFSDANWSSMGGVPYANGEIFASAADSSGNLYVGGDFTIIGDVIANHVAKWNGSRWSALGTGADGDPFSSVYALTVSGSDVYVGGWFTTAGGVSATNIAKWNGNDWSALGSGVDSTVYSLAVSGGNVFASGDFTTAGGVAANYIARWDGTSWSPLGAGLNGAAWTLAVSGGDVYAGGQFTMAGGAPASYIAKWNGGSWSQLGLGMEYIVRVLAVSGNNLYAGGEFSTVTNNNGVPVTANYIAKWNGSTWSALGSGLDDHVHALAVSGADVYAGGHFTTAGGIPAVGTAKWSGSTWSALDSTMYAGTLSVSETNLYATAGIRAFRWNNGAWSNLGTGMDDYVAALALSGSNLYAGGNFTTAGNIAANHIARWDGSSWSALGSGLSGGSSVGYPRVSALVVSGNDVYAGGDFTTAGNIPAFYIAKWNGNWSALGSGLGGVNFPNVSALAVSGSDLYAGGGFATATNNGGVTVTVNYIAKWNGNSWSALGLGVDGSVKALAVSSGNLYVGGEFTRATNSGGVAVTVNNIAKWDGNSWAALGSGMNHYVIALAVSGTDVYAAGYFTTAGGISTSNRVAKWNGATWSALNSVSGLVRSDYPYVPEVAALAASGSNLYAAGGFTTADGCHNIAKWDGSRWSGLGSGLGSDISGVSALTVSGSHLYAGGGFITAGGKVSGGVAMASLGDAPGYNQLTGTLSPGGAMQFSYIGYPATNYALDRTFNLSPPINWVGQQTNTITVSGMLTFTNMPLTGTNNFWRVRSLP